jgi:hypothetical protein
MAVTFKKQTDHYNAGTRTYSIKVKIKKVKLSMSNQLSLRDYLADLEMSNTCK